MYFVSFLVSLATSLVSPMNPKPRYEMASFAFSPVCIGIDYYLQSRIARAPCTHYVAWLRPVYVR